MMKDDRKTVSKTTMSVREMRYLLGLKKTDSYWLLKKEYFLVHMVNKKLRVDIESFENWYANQLRYKKITGDPPGRNLKKDSLSPAEMAELLDVPEATVYQIMKDKGIPYFLVDNWKRVRKKDFLDWYQSQSHYRLKEVRARDHVLEKESLSVPQMAFLLKIDRDEARAVMTSDKNGLKPFRMLGTTWVSRESFTDWLGRQNRYQMRFRTIENGVKAHRNWVLNQKRTSIQNAQRAKWKKQENSRRGMDKDNSVSGYPSVTSEFVSSETVKDCLTLNGASLIPEKQEEYSSKVRRNPGQTSLNPDYVSVDEAASIAGVTKTAIRKWITSGRLPARKVVRSYRILRADLERIMKEGE